MRIKYGKKETHYRFFKLTVNGITKFYLQFKEVETMPDFPRFWRKRRNIIWRFVYSTDQEFDHFLTADELPVFGVFRAEDIKEKLVCSVDVNDLVLFARKYPNIEIYVDRINIERALKLDKKERSLKHKTWPQ